MSTSSRCVCEPRSDGRAGAMVAAGVRVPRACWTGHETESPTAVRFVAGFAGRTIPFAAWRGGRFHLVFWRGLVLITIQMMVGAHFHGSHVLENLFILQYLRLKTPEVCR